MLINVVEQFIVSTYLHILVLKIFKFIADKNLGILNCLDQPLKRKSETANHEQGVGAQIAGCGNANVSSSMQTPISGKAGKSQKAPKSSAQATSSLGKDILQEVLSALVYASHIITIRFTILSYSI